MHFLAAALTLVCQSIEPVPAIGQVGEGVTITVRSATGEAMSGVPVQVRLPGGEVVEVGGTDDQGSVLCVLDDVGTHELRAAVPPGGVSLIRPYAVLAPARRWAFALVCLPAGVLLVWWNLRTRRNIAAADSAAGG